MAQQKFQIKSVTAGVLALLSGAAFAGPVVVGNLNDGQITLAATYALPGNGSTQDGMTLSPPSTTATGADFYHNDYQDAGTVFFHTYGDAGATSYFGARVTGTGNFSATTSTRYSRTFTNTTGVAQLFNFSFHVDSGETSINGTGLGFADLLLQVSKNGQAIARDRTTRSQDINGNQSCVSDDLGSLGGYMDCASSYANDANFNVSLGLIGAGESFTLDYDIVATVSGDLGSDGGGGYGDCPTLAKGDGEVALLECGGGGAGSATARSGDPFGWGNPANFNVGPTANIPEPSSLALLGLSLAGLAATTRRRKPANEAQG
ncbi:MAG: hypothetical protein CFE41_11395 [Burkholderiales bacterium PBB2]|nr:MAG: hypothetical protein CFE41_11395 [Burkholderiales bacterium PBB2]